ncbi:MAG: hypothetical protein ACW981_15325 [Candidatus Hodarchaeales archaeon]
MNIIDPREPASISNVRLPIISDILVIKSLILSSIIVVVGLLK